MKQKLKTLACTCHVHVNGYTVLKNWRIVLKKAIFPISFVLQESFENLGFPVSIVTVTVKITLQAISLPDFFRFLRFLEVVRKNEIFSVGKYYDFKIMTL